jgi:hypothetical protein
LARGILIDVYYQNLFMDNEIYSFRNVYEFDPREKPRWQEDWGELDG